MPLNRTSWLNISRSVSQAFIQDEYGEEESFFDTFWDAFSSRIADRLDGSCTDLPALDTTQRVISEIHFAQSSAVDLVTPVVLATVAETISRINIENISGAKLKKLIGDAAARFGAQAGLAAALVKHLPVLCSAALAAGADDSDAVVSKPPTNQFRIWTNGETRVVNNIDKYEKQKDSYLFWIDLNARSHVSPVSPDRKLSPRSIQLLKCLVELLGSPMPVSEILTCAFDEPSGTVVETDENRIEQQLTKLHKYCGEQFRQHLFVKWFRNGLGLKDSFADKYFLFERTR